MFAFLMLALGLTATACSDRGDVAQLPKPGLQQRLQIQVVSDARYPLEEYWGFPKKEALAALLQARVDWSVVSTEAQAEEVLRSANGRPVDLLILGSGLPYKVAGSLKLPKVEGRKTVVIGSPPSEGFVTVQVSERDVQRSVVSFCAHFKLGKKCERKPLESEVRTGEETPAWLVFVPKWKEHLEGIVSPKAPLSPSQHMSLDFFSGNLLMERGPALSSPAQIQSFDAWKKETMLKAIAEGASL